MKIIQFSQHKDFGSEYCIFILRGSKYSLFQISLSWNDFSGWPYIQISSGCGRMISILFWVYKFGLSIDIFAPNWLF